MPLVECSIETKQLFLSQCYDLSCDEVYFLLNCDFFTNAIVNAVNGRCKYYSKLLISRKTDNDQLQD